METVLVPKAPVTVPFVCPLCAGASGVHLISLSRAGGVDCLACGKWLRATDVMRAMHSPRDARAPDAAPERTRGATAPQPHVAGARPLASRRDRIVWPPTTATRAAASANAGRS
ncbi:MAG TPA: hypothetical protein VNZ52_13355 [Candidatus Thermoplasmatota archaeon]|nr:hypothetical protein [Candidatus Thermoplasmatota archaeon]